LKNKDPFMPWNDPVFKDNPAEIWNHPAYRDDPFAPWNNPGTDRRDYEEYWKEHRRH